MLEGACRPWMELTDPDGGDDRQVSAEQIVVTDSDKVSVPELGLGCPLVQPVQMKMVMKIFEKYLHYERLPK